MEAENEKQLSSTALLQAGSGIEESVGGGPKLKCTLYLKLMSAMPSNYVVLRIPFQPQQKFFQSGCYIVEFFQIHCSPHVHFSISKWQWKTFTFLVGGAATSKMSGSYSRSQ